MVMFGTTSTGMLMMVAFAVTRLLRMLHVTVLMMLLVCDRGGGVDDGPV
jgi:hypothetical protein